MSAATVRAPGAVGPSRRRKVQGREHAREGPREPGHVVRHDLEPQRGEAGGVAVGVQHEARALGGDPLDDARQDGAAADRPQPLVAAAHAPGETAGDEHAEGRFSRGRHRSSRRPYPGRFLGRCCSRGR